MPTDPLSLTFAGSFLVGLFFLLITSFTGHEGIAHHAGHGHIELPFLGGHNVPAHGPAHAGHGAGHQAHVEHHGHGEGEGFSIFAILNPLSIALFLIGFGFFGFVFHATTAFALPIVFVLAGIGGLIIAILILSLVNRIFGNTEATTIQDVSDRTGLLGKVNMTILQDGIGEIIYVSPGGLRKSVPARSVNGQRLERGQEIVVVNYQRGIAEVDTWDHFVNQEETGSVSATEADDLATLRALLEDADKNTTTEYSLQQDSQRSNE
jgi:hypothetical protein